MTGRTKEMSDGQLRRAAREYARDELGGGDGYNPYAAELRSREDRAAAKTARARPRSEADILCDLEVADGELMHEAGACDPVRIAALNKELDDLRAAEAAEFAAEWTPEITRARRLQWNTLTRAGKLDTWAEKLAFADKHGWSLAGLQKAIALYAE